MKATSVSSTLFSHVALCFALVTALYCTGCTSNIPYSSADKRGDDSLDDTQMEGLTIHAPEEELLSGVSFPNEYLITYEVESEVGTLYQVSGGKDAQGRVYIKRQLEEILCVPTDGGYYQYYMDNNGTLSKLDNNVYTQAFVDEMMQDFLEVAGKYTLHQIDNVSDTNRAQIAGRDCVVCEISIKTAALTQKYNFAIDDETGVCMEWGLASEVLNQALPTNLRFKCTEFIVSDVTLPIPD